MLQNGFTALAFSKIDVELPFEFVAYDLRDSFLMDPFTFAVWGAECGCFFFGVDALIFSTE